MDIRLASLEICDTEDNWLDANISDLSKTLTQVVNETVGERVDGKLTFWYKAGKVDYATAIHLVDGYLKFNGCPRTARGELHLFLDIQKPCDPERTLEEFVKEHEELIRKYAPTISEEELVGPTVDESIPSLEELQKKLTSKDIADLDDTTRLKIANAILEKKSGR